MKILIPEADISTIEAALHLAAETYDHDAKVCEDTPRVAEQFKRQADDARRLLASFEDERNDEKGEICVMSPARWRKEHRRSENYVGPAGWPATAATPGARRLPNRYEDDK